MQGLNKIFILGHIGDVPEMHISRTGRKYAALSVATHRFVPNEDDADGDSSEQSKSKKTDWHYVRAWGHTGELCAKYLMKGQAVLVEGYLSQYRQQSQDGRTEWKTGINAIRVQFLPHHSKNRQPTESSEINFTATDSQT